MSISEERLAGNSQQPQNQQKKHSKANHHVPVWWYHTLRSKKDRPDYPAILILAELYYLRDFFGVEEYGYGYDFLQRRLSLGRDAMKNALRRLEGAGLIRRSCRHVRSQNRTFANVLHITLNESALVKLKAEFNKRGGLFSRNVSERYRLPREDAQILGMLENTEQMRGSDLGEVISGLQTQKAANSTSKEKDKHDNDDDSGSSYRSGRTSVAGFLDNSDPNGLFSYGDALHELANRGRSFSAACLERCGAIKISLSQIGANWRETLIGGVISTTSQTKLFLRLINKEVMVMG